MTATEPKVPLPLLRAAQAFDLLTEARAKMRARALWRGRQILDEAIDRFGRQVYGPLLSSYAKNCPEPCDGFRKLDEEREP